MIIDYVKDLSNIDSNLSLTINYSKDKVFSFTINDRYLNDIYSFSSTNLYECMERLERFKKALTNNKDFSSLVNEILEETFVSN